MRIAAETQSVASHILLQKQESGRAFEYSHGKIFQLVSRFLFLRSGDAWCRNTAAQSNTRAEILRLWKADFRKDPDFPSSDRTYLAQVVAARTGISLADAGSALIRLWLRPRSTPTTRDARPRIFRSGPRRHFYWAHSLHCATALGTIAS